MYGVEARTSFLALGSLGGGPVKAQLSSSERSIPTKVLPQNIAQRKLGIYLQIWPETGPIMGSRLASKIGSGCIELDIAGYVELDI